jgi:hypothetical protein
MKNTRVGFFDILPGVSTYHIVFDPPFSFPPNAVETSLQLSGSGGEFLAAAVSRTSITIESADVILSASPTEASVGSRVTWKAK